MAKPDDGKPTRRMIEKLIKDLYSRHSDDKTECEIDQVRANKDGLLAKIINSRQFKAFEKKEEDLRRKACDFRERMRRLISAANRDYLANGATPRVLYRLNKIVKELDQRSNA